ncbi:MAG: restriction endonuclease subunit S [Thermodesulfobacteriota bacterium]|jgi:type I restriction enzyme S subunit
MNSNLSFPIPNSELPDGWRWVKLGEVAKEFVNGGTPSTNIPEYWDGNIPWITGADVTDFWVSGGRKFITEDGLKNSVTHLVPRNTVLVVTRTGVGKVGIAANDLCFSQDITGVICSEEIYPEYLAWYIFSERNNLTNIQRGATIKGLTRNDIESLQIPLPPLEEQKSISLKIQELMQEVERARTACEKQLEAAKALPSAHLREVFKSEEAKKWERKRLGEVLEEPLKNGLNYRKEDFGAGVKFVNVSDVFCSARINNKKLDRINVSIEDVKKYQLQTGDILIVRSSLKREGIAYPALFIEDEEPVVFCGFLIRIRPDKGKVAPFYLLNYLRSSIAREKLIGDSDTVTITNVDQGTLLSLDIPIPSLDEQQRITFELKEKMVQVENLQSAIQNQHSALSVLPQSILRKAFGGKL